jgi:hypothetical protein
VKCTRDRQRNDFHRARLRGRFGNPLTRRVVPGNGNVAGAQKVGTLQDLSRLTNFVTQPLNLGPLHSQNADHAAGRSVRGILHGLATLLNQLQPGLELHRAGKHNRRVLAQAEPRRRGTSIYRLRRLLSQ